jgi:hypothetical protein
VGEGRDEWLNRFSSVFYAPFYSLPSISSLLSSLSGLFLPILSSLLFTPFPSSPFLSSFQVSGEDIAGLMKTWTTRMGYPFLSVRSYCTYCTELGWAALTLLYRTTLHFNGLGWDGIGWDGMYCDSPCCYANTCRLYITYRGVRSSHSTHTHHSTKES